MLMTQHLNNPISGVNVEVLVSTKDSKGELFRIRSTMKANQFNKAPFHYHHNFSEYFQVVDGQLNMTIETDKRNIVLKAGESFMIASKCPHTFWNASDKPVTYIVDVTPAENFEKALRINHALAAAGMASRKGTPSNIFHIAILAQLGNTWFYGVPRWFQVLVFKLLSIIGGVLGITKRLFNLIAE